MEFQDLINDICHGRVVKPSDLLPFLCSEVKAERCRINGELAEAFWKARNVQQARTFIQRAWVLSGFSQDLLPLYLKIHSALGDIICIQSAYKHIGMKKASRRKICEALQYFTSSMYAYATYQQIDHYVYDFDILDRIKEMAKPHQFEPSLKAGCLVTRKIRLAYLVFGMMHSNSVVAKINGLFARFHDKSRFEVAFFVPEKKELLFQSVEAKHNVKVLEGYNCKVVAPVSDNEEERLFEIATQIHTYQPDILVTNALLADLRHYFITSLRPSPVVIGFSQGSPPQFASPDLDHSISWTKHPLIECPCDCSLVNLEVDLPEKDTITFYTKQELGLPEDSCIIISAGRYTKFQDGAYWKAMIDIIMRFAKVYYLVVGVGREELPFLQEFMTPDLLKRLRFFGWRKDFVRILGLADIVVDTYPSGGGVVLLDAMALGIPSVSFRNNYLKLFDQNDWSPAEELAPTPELLVDRDNFEHFQELMMRLIQDQVFRYKIGKKCKERVFLENGCPERMVRRCERVYIDVLRKRLTNGWVPVSSPENCPGDGAIGRFGYCRHFTMNSIRNIFPTVMARLRNLTKS